MVMIIKKNRFLRFFLILLPFLFLSCVSDESQNDKIEDSFEVIEILVDQPHKPVKSFHIDSNGMFLELLHSKRKEELILLLKLDKNELDSISNYIVKLKSFKFQDKPNSSCADALMYDMTITIEGRTYNFSNVICNEIQYPDQLVKLLIDFSKSKSKDSLFTKYRNYLETQSQVDSILNLNSKTGKNL